MSDRDYFVEVAAENIPHNTVVIHKFGHNSAVGTDPVPITHGGFYRTPQVSGATKLRVKAGNAADTADGAGARSIYIEGLDVEGNWVNEVIPTAGESAGANSVHTYLRLFRAYVFTSGTYGSQSASSHVADIVIENSAGDEDWATIDLDPSGFGDAQTEIGAFTVPKGKAAYLNSIRYSVDTTKITSIFFYKREKILDTSAPYRAVRKQFGMQGAIRDGEIKFNAPMKFDELTDIGFLAFVNSTTAAVSIEFELIIRDKE